jgi:hypothetical protein
MELDPIQEIRAIREQLLRKFDYDIDKYADYVEAKYKNSDFNFVESKPKRPKRATQTHGPKKAVRPSAKKKTTTKPSNRGAKPKKSA